MTFSCIPAQPSSQATDITTAGEMEERSYFLPVIQTPIINDQPNTNTSNIHAIILVIEASGSTTQFYLTKV